MSRIQQILDRAERDGALQRMQPLADSLTAVQDPAEIVGPDGAVAPVSSGTKAAGITPGDGVEDAMPEATPKGALDSRLVTATAPDGVPAEQYRALRTRIVQTVSGGPVSVVLVTSPGRNEGKSLTVANLGLTMAQDFQQRICIVDADLRAPRQAALFGVSQTPGLTDVLIGRSTLDQALLGLEDYRISVLPAGMPATHPAELLGTMNMRRVIDALRTRFDRVIIDVPAATPLADVAILSPLVDSVVLVVRAGLTSKPAIHDAMSAIEPGKLLGFVLNEVAA